MINRHTTQLHHKDRTRIGDVAPTVLHRRLKRVAELTREAAGLADTTREMILSRVEATLRADVVDGALSKRCPAGVVQEFDCRAQSSTRPDSPRSNHERLEHVERSMTLIHRTLNSIVRMARAVCERHGTRGDA